jgi:hypothetical protein
MKIIWIKVIEKKRNKDTRYEYEALYILYQLLALNLCIKKLCALLKVFGVDGEKDEVYLLTHLLMVIIAIERSETPMLP